MEYHSKWSNRRRASGILKPFIYLMVEVIILLALCWFVSLSDILAITILVSLGSIYFLITSSVVRYQKVIKRQQYYKNENIKH